MIDLRTPEAVAVGTAALEELFRQSRPETVEQMWERLAGILQPALELIERVEQLRPGLQEGSGS